MKRARERARTAAPVASAWGWPTPGRALARVDGKRAQREGPACGARCPRGGKVPSAGDNGVAKGPAEMAAYPVVPAVLARPGG